MVGNGNLLQVEDDLLLAKGIKVNAFVQEGV